MVLTSVLTLFGLGLVAAIVLAAASRVFYVEEDPRVEAVMDALPGANCGGCGYAGCEGYAIAVVNEANVAASLCVAGSADTSITIGELTGKSVGAADPMISFRRCDKVAGKVAEKYQYHGMPSCAAATLLMNGSDLCSWSCLGFGDCVEVCPFDAMEVIDRLVVINPRKCTGCGICIKACPRDSLDLIPMRARVAVTCATKDKLRAVMDICEVGCINCGKCIKACPAKAISTRDSRIEIDQQKCLSYGSDCEEVCIATCPRKILRPSCPTLSHNIEMAHLKELEITAKGAEAAAQEQNQPTENQAQGS